MVPSHVHHVHVHVLQFSFRFSGVSSSLMKRLERRLSEMLNVKGHKDGESSFIGSGYMVDD